MKKVEWRLDPVGILSNETIVVILIAQWEGLRGDLQNWDSCTEVRLVGQFARCVAKSQRLVRSDTGIEEFCLEQHNLVFWSGFWSMVELREVIVQLPAIGVAQSLV